MLSSKPMQAILREVFVRRSAQAAAVAARVSTGVSSAAYTYLFSSSRFISSKNITTTITSKLPRKSEILHYESDSTSNENTLFHHQHITHNSLRQRYGDENDVSYEQDYDAHNLHMTPGSVTNQDSEQYELEVHYDDITPVRDGASSYYDGCR